MTHLCIINNDLDIHTHWFSTFTKASRRYKLSGHRCVLFGFSKSVILLNTSPNDRFDEHINATLVSEILKSSCEVGILLSSDLYF